MRLFSLKKTDVNKPDATEVKDWVAAEEKIFRDFKEKKSSSYEIDNPEVDWDESQEEEAFSTQTITLSPTLLTKRQATHSDKKNPFLQPSTWFLILGWVLVSALVFFFFKEVMLRKHISSQYAQILAEKKELTQSYEGLKIVLSGQRKEIQYLDRKLHAMAEELSFSKKKEAAFGLAEQAQREELIRTTSRYEEQLDFTRKLILARDEALNVLRAQMQASKNLVDVSSAAGISGALAVQQKQLPVSPDAVPAVRGKVTVVNARYRFVVTNLGSDRGANSGRGVDIYQNGKKLATGIIDRVYPTMSAVTILDQDSLNRVQEGNAVSFSD